MDRNTHQAPVSQQERFALRRLHKDWKELEREKDNLTTVAALPTSDIFVWHCNLRPDDGPYAGTIFHLILRFPRDYPHSPPRVELCTHLSHPNVFGGWRSEGSFICLDMIQEAYTAEPYVGWTSAYSIMSLLLQLQSFLFAENVPQGTGGTESARRSVRSLDRGITAARGFWLEIETHDGPWVKHTHEEPWPPLPRYSGEAGHQVTRDQVRRGKANTKVVTATHHTTRRKGARRRQPLAPFQYCSDDFPPLGAETGEETGETDFDNAFTADFTGAQTDEASAEMDIVVAAANSGSQTVTTTVVAPSSAILLPSEVHSHIFSFLDGKDLLRARDVCSRWRQVIVSYNLFERTQIMCFHSKATLEDKNAILGIGIKVEHYPGSKELKEASSPLDLLSLQAFEDEGVRTGVWGGASETCQYFLPLIFNTGHAVNAIKKIEQTVYSIMKDCKIPSHSRSTIERRSQGRQQNVLHPAQSHDEFRPIIGKTERRNRDRKQAHQQVQHPDGFHPTMIFQLLAVLMNSMVVELMNSAEPSLGGRRRQAQNDEHGVVRRHASEKALEGYCAFHHMLLYFAKRDPALIEFADEQVNKFASQEYHRHKRCTPNLGVLLVCLTLSQKGWATLRKPLVMEVFDRNVRWLLRKCPHLCSLSASKRLELTFEGAKTSLRLLMFQVYFMTRIGRPQATRGPMDVLARYERQLGKPTAAQKEDLQRNAKEILAATSWSGFFQRLGGGPGPSTVRLNEILNQAVKNSERKRYHYN